VEDTDDSLANVGEMQIILVFLLAIMRFFKATPEQDGAAGNILTGPVFSVMVVLICLMTFIFCVYEIVTTLLTELDEEDIKWFRGKTRRARAETGKFLVALRDRALSGAGGDAEATETGGASWIREKMRRARAETGKFLAAFRGRSGAGGDGSGEGGVEMTDIDNLAIEAAYPERGDAVVMTANPMRAAAEPPTAAEAALAEDAPGRPASSSVFEMSNPMAAARGPPAAATETRGATPTADRPRHRVSIRTAPPPGGADLA